MIQNDDWRLRGQEEYLTGRTFTRTKFTAKKTGDHTHCEFCWHKFMEDNSGIKDCSTEGYCTGDGLYWVCDECYEDFNNSFNWKTVLN